MTVMSASCGEPRPALAMGSENPDAPGGDLGGSGSMSAGCVTDWEWPRVQAAVLGRSLPRVRESSPGDADGDLQNIRGGR